MQGKQDRIVLPAASDNIARHISDVSRVDYDHCGHLACVEVTRKTRRTFSVRLPMLMCRRVSAELDYG
jgi:hypothetical protein